MAKPQRKDKDKVAPPAATAEPAAVPPAVVAPDDPGPGLTRRGWGLVALAVLVVQLPLLHYACRGDPPAQVALPYRQDFSDPGVVGRDFTSQGGYWRVRQGALLSPGTLNNPLWLSARLPPDAVVEVDVQPLWPQSEVKLELFGNGEDHASGYVLVHGAQAASIARRADAPPTLEVVRERARRIAAARGKPGADPVAEGIIDASTRYRVETRSLPLEPGRTYRWRVERQGAVVRWFVDGELLLELDDPFPLKGDGQDRLGLTSNDGDVDFDNLLVAGLDQAPPRATPQPPEPAGPSEDTFERAELGALWRPTGPGVASIRDGALVVETAHNQPVWLARPLPDAAVIEFDAWTDDPRGDIKVEAWGDGRSGYRGDLRLAYTASGYVFIHGGWGNSLNVIARRDEHAHDRVEAAGPRVVPGKRYRWRIVRDGGKLEWSLDGKVVATLDDPSPLTGPRNRYFAFSGWESLTHFDNFSVRPLRP